MISAAVEGIAVIMHEPEPASRNQSGDFLLFPVGAVFGCEEFSVRFQPFSVLFIYRADIEVECFAGIDDFGITQVFTRQGDRSRFAESDAVCRGKDFHPAVETDVVFSVAKDDVSLSFPEGSACEGVMMAV